MSKGPRLADYQESILRLVSCTTAAFVITPVKEMMHYNEQYILFKDLADSKWTTEQV